MFPIISRNLTSKLIVFISALMRIPAINLESVIRLLWLFPISIAALVFLVGMRKGYALHGATMNPIFLPPSFSQAIQYIRERQNRDVVFGATSTRNSAQQLED
jgi:hypothetical protein